jgi:hypothetical protein
MIPGLTTRGVEVRMEICRSVEGADGPALVLTVGSVRRHAKKNVAVLTRHH